MCRKQLLREGRNKHEQIFSLSLSLTTPPHTVIEWVEECGVFPMGDIDLLEIGDKTIKFVFCFVFRDFHGSKVKPVSEECKIVNQNCR